MRGVVDARASSALSAMPRTRDVEERSEGDGGAWSCAGAGGAGDGCRVPSAMVRTAMQTGRMFNHFYRLERKLTGPTLDFSARYNSIWAWR